MENFQEEITLQSLAENEDIQIGYSDSDIVVVDSIQKFAEINAAHIAMNAIAICTNGRIQGLMNGIKVELRKNQIAIIPQNVVVTDIMVSPDFDLKAMFLTNSILQSFLREKMNVWNDVMYVQRQHIITLDDDGLLFYTNFYDMLCISAERGLGNPFRTEVIRALFRAAMLGLCGEMKHRLKPVDKGDGVLASIGHFQSFLDLLHSSEVKYQPVEDYASMLCISPKYLTAICKKHSGKTASEWIREQVLEQIRFYLRQTDLSLKQVCDRTGFSNPSFFGKYVKEHLGMTPTDYRNHRT